MNSNFMRSSTRKPIKIARVPMCQCWNTQKSRRNKIRSLGSLSAPILDGRSDSYRPLVLQSSARRQGCPQSKPEHTNRMKAGSPRRSNTLHILHQETVPSDETSFTGYTKNAFHQTLSGKRYTKNAFPMKFTLKLHSPAWQKPTSIHV